jgi:hypothetical protein
MRNYNNDEISTKITFIEIFLKKSLNSSISIYGIIFPNIITQV